MAQTQERITYKVVNITSLYECGPQYHIMFAALLKVNVQEFIMSWKESILICLFTAYVGILQYLGTGIQKTMGITMEK